MSTLLKDLLFKYSIRKYFLTLIIITLFTIVIAQLNINSYFQFGDTGLFYSTVHNIFTRFSSESFMFGTTARMLFDLNLMVMEPSDICEISTKYVELSSHDKDFLSYHSNYILYALAPFHYFFSTPQIVQGSIAFSYVILAYFVFLNFFKNKISIIMSLLLVSTFILHPGWSHSIFGQPYVDKYYLLFGILLCYFTDRKNIPILITLWLLSMLINEKIMIINALLFSGLSIVYYFFEKKEKSYCFLLLMMGIVSFILFFMMSKIVLANIYYSSAIPGDISSLINYLKVERNLIGISSFFLINSLLLIPIFIKNKPIFFLMLLIMSPNIFGNIGGAEKTNFYTHYHSLYIPILFYFSSKYLAIIIGNYKRLTYLPFTICIVYLIFYSSLHFGADLKPEVKNFSKNDNYYKKFINIFSTNKVSENLEELIKKEIPLNSKISAVEDAFPYLYKYKNVYYYPIFMESADYVITRYDSNSDKFSGSFMNLKNKNEADQCLYEKGKELGFNYDEKIEVGRGLVMIKKSK